MNVLWLMLVAVIALILGYRLYSRYIAGILGENDNNPTPAVAMKDGVDYVPTKNQVVFAHHFASIAGAGPILGPTMALLYGVAPVWLWCIFGGIFIGAVHDYTTLLVSIREKGHSIAEIARKSLGNTGFVLMICFTILMCILVTSAFLVASATSLTSLVSLEAMRLPADQTILHTVEKNGMVMGKIGGIASTSVIVITLFAPLVGWLNYRKDASLWITNPLAIFACVVSIIAGVYIPVNLDTNTWMILLAIYSFIAAGVPVWILLQPRDFTNVFILYAGILGLGLGAVGAGFAGVEVVAPMWNVAAATPKLGLIWPFLFITVACGAISGFHALVAGGTSAKQITTETAARKIGYGGMLLEVLLAIGVVVALCGGFNFEEYAKIVYPDPSLKMPSNPILAFALAMAGLMHKGLGFPMVYGTVFGILMVEGFIATTLDTAVRINRYLFEELWAIIFKNPPKFLKSYLFNSGLSVVLMLILGYTNAFTALWPIFGTANQLLAALTLITLVVWLAKLGKKYAFALMPALFMVVTTIFSLFYLLERYFKAHNYILLTTDVLMLALAVGIVIVAFQVRKHLVTKKS